MSSSQVPPTDQASDSPGSDAAQPGSAPAKKLTPFEQVFSPHALVWSEASRLARRRELKVSDLALCALQDPVLVLELLKRANAMFFSAGRPPITNAVTAITRLGSEVVAEVLDELFAREPIEDLEIRAIFELHRNRCKRAGILAHMLSEVVSKPIAEECHTAGLFLFVGDMLAVQHLGQRYVKLYNSQNFVTVQCKLAQEHKFDPEKMGLNYLQKSGVPDLVISAINRSSNTKNPERAPMRPICFAAAEMIDSFDNEKWDKLAPGKQLPPKSALRFLQIAGTTYLKLYERASEYLYLERAARERTPIEDLGKPVPVEVERIDAGLAGDALGADEQLSLESDLEDLLNSTPPPPPPGASGPAKVPPPTRRTPPPPLGTKQTTGGLDDVAEVPGPPKELIRKSYDLNPKDPADLGARKKQAAPIAPPPPLRTSGGNSLVASITSEVEKAKTSENLLRDILGVLIEQGPFEKSALIVVSKDRKTAIVVAARGPQISTGQQFLLDDPLSPLAQCFSKVQSFGNRASSESPWGSRAFALAPIDANHETPVALYADCGLTGSITFEARRIFRVVVDILNQKLPTIPGGLPVEI
jgi:HD-like signal output (HDOD) protein